MKGAKTDPEPAKRSPQVEIHDTALRSFTGYNLKRAYLVIEAKVHRILKDHDLRVTSFSALGIIIENPRLTQTALANALDIERSSTVVIVDAVTATATSRAPSIDASMRDLPSSRWR